MVPLCNLLCLNLSHIYKWVCAFKCFQQVNQEDMNLPSQAIFEVLFPHKLSQLGSIPYNTLVTRNSLSMATNKVMAKWSMRTSWMKYAVKVYIYFSIPHFENTNFNRFGLVDLNSSPLTKYWHASTLVNQLFKASKNFNTYWISNMMLPVIMDWGKGAFFKPNSVLQTIWNISVKAPYAF